MKSKIFNHNIYNLKIFIHIIYNKTQTRKYSKIKQLNLLVEKLVVSTEPIHTFSEPFLSINILDSLLLSCTKNIVFFSNHILFTG